MITDEQLVEYQSGRMAARDRAVFEEELAGDEDALRRLFEQEQTDAALRFLAGGGGDRARVKEGILEVALGVSSQEFKKEIVDALGRDARGWHTLSIWRWLEKNWPSLGAATAVACIALMFWIGQRNQVNERRTVAMDGLMPRKASDWPFAANSPWNMPIGSEAKFVEIDPEGLNLELGAYIADWRETHPLVHLHPGDPMTAIYLRGNPDPVATLPIPTEIFQESDWRVAMHLVNGGEVIELTEVTAGEGGLVAAALRRADLRGSGIPYEFESATRSGLSTFAGAIRQSELTNGIRHALGALIPIDAMASKAGHPGFVWPAAWAPTEEDFRGQLGGKGNVFFGSLLAIPPSVDLGELGLPGNSVAYEIARAMQDYGVYVKDVFFTDGFAKWQQAGSPDLVFCADVESEKLPPEFPEQLRRVVRELKLVTNNGPDSIGGGGRPRRPLAPPFAPAAERIVR